MKFIDPFLVTCGCCSAKSAQRVADLLRLRATCPACGTPLDEVGKKMRAACDDWGEFCTASDIAGRLEEMLGKAISDAELVGVHTLRDIASVIQVHLSPGSEGEAKAIELVREAAKMVPWCSVRNVAIDIPLMGAIDPGRWNRE